MQEAGLDITVDQWVVMDKLSAGPMSQIKVAEAVYKDAPTLTRIIDLLCHKGFAHRQMDPLDRRKFQVALTNAGMKMFARVQPLMEGFRKEGWTGLSQQDYEHLHRIMSAILHNFKIETAGSLSDFTSVSDSKAA